MNDNNPHLAIKIRKLYLQMKIRKQINEDKKMEPNNDDKKTLKALPDDTFFLH